MAFVKPNIDGPISAGEWNDASSTSFTLTTWVSESHACTIYVKNDATNLYLAAVFGNDDYSRPQAWGDQVIFFCDNDNDGKIAWNGEVGDDALQLVATQGGRDNFLYIFPEGGVSWQDDQNFGGSKQSCFSILIYKSNSKCHWRLRF